MHSNMNIKKTIYTVLTDNDQHTLLSNPYILKPLRSTGQVINCHISGLYSNNYILLQPCYCRSNILPTSIKITAVHLFQPPDGNALGFLEGEFSSCWVFFLFYIDGRNKLIGELLQLAQPEATPSGLGQLDFSSVGRRYGPG